MAIDCSFRISAGVNRPAVGRFAVDRPRRAPVELNLPHFGIDCGRWLRTRCLRGMASVSQPDQIASNS